MTEEARGNKQKNAHVETAASVVPPSVERRRLGKGRPALTIPVMWAKMIVVLPSIRTSGFSLSSSIVGLWRSWERASMAWKRSSVRSRPGPPYFQLLADTPLFSLVAFGSKTPVPRDLGPRVFGDDALYLQ